MASSLYFGEDPREGLLPQQRDFNGGTKICDNHKMIDLERLYVNSLLP